MISGAKPGPSSLMVTATSSSLQSAVDLDAVVREIDRVLEQIAEPVEDRRIARAHRRRRIVLPGRRRWRCRNCGAAPPPPRSAPTAACGRTARRSTVRSACRGCRGSAAPARAAACTSSTCGESASSARSSSLAITEMVDSGVPSSWAAAAASPSSCDRCCSRASTSSVAASASASWRPSSVICQA